MEFKEMTVEQLQERMAAIPAELDAEGADLNALEEEVRGIKAELESRKAEEAKRNEIRAAVATGTIGEVVTTFTEEKKPVMNDMEIRNSAEYIDAFAEFVKSGDDTECRSLLTENATGGTLPVPAFVGEIIAENFRSSKILNRVRKSYARGDFKQPFEYGAPIAGTHTEGGDPIAEEELLVGYVLMKANTWKKWIGVSDEALDLMNGEALLRYVYDEISRGIVKAREKAVCDAILAAPQTATKSAPSVAKTGSAAGAIDDIVNAEALLGDVADDIVVILSKADYATYRSLQMAANYGVDPFDGLEVIKCDYATAPIVGDLSGVMENFTRGDDEIQIKMDDKTRMKQDMVDILGRQPSAIAVVADKAFAKVSA